MKMFLFEVLILKSLNLNTKILKLKTQKTGVTPLHAVLHLLKTKQFTMCKMLNIGDWIFNQICEAELPLHPQLCQVIKSLVKLNVPENKKEFNQLQKPISYYKLVKTAKDENQNMLVRCLLTYYLVTLAASLLKNSGLKIS